jgi:TatD DNase family protein
MRLVDTHCHLDLYPDYQTVLEEIEYQGIRTIAVTNTPSVFRQSANLTRRSWFVETALGLHPELAACRETELALFDELLPMTRFVGEIGLDYSTSDSCNQAAQRRVFRILLDRCALASDKILTVHSRRAEVDVLSMIGEKYPGTVILHWFSGSLKILEQAVSCGYYFSVNTAMAKSITGQRVISNLPRDRVLTETDGPFVQVGRRPARPRDIGSVINSLAQIWDLDSLSTAQIVQDNFNRILTA